MTVKRLTINATVLEATRGTAGPAALLNWADNLGHATVAASCTWSSPAAAGLAVVEAGDRIVVTGVITDADTPCRPWLPGETLTMVIEAIESPQPVPSQKARQ